ncbi:MAG: hypothetical protein SPL12_08885 [Bacteroidales bacterium]|nr:hypothetical protein [Bacteroidales bacterium]
MKKNFLHYIIIAAIATAFTACGGGNGDKESKGVAFNPGQKSDENVLSDYEREQKLAEKRAAYNASQAPDDVTATLNFEGKIKLTALVPESEGLTHDQYRQIESKMMQIVSMNGVGGMGGNPRFVIAPMVNVLQKDVTSTAPAKHMIKYDITFYIADIVSGTVFSTYNMQTTGVGESDQRAFTAAFSNLNPKDAAIQQFVKDGQEKILAYYKANGAKFLQEADMLASQRKYEQAMAILASFPVEADPHYSEAVKKSVVIFDLFLKANAETSLSMMKSALGNKTDGFNSEAMNYYAMIPAGVPARKEADQLYNNYMKNLDAQQKVKWEREQKEWESDHAMKIKEREAALNMQQKKADTENAIATYNAQEAQMRARIEMDGQQCLLDKYKKDAAYNRLPWIRRVFYLGDHDPFDGYEKDKNC